MLCQSDMLALEDRRAEAMRMVQGNLICSDRALILGIKSGELAHSEVVLESPNASKGKATKAPSLVLLANSGHANGTSTFGRGSAHGVPVVDHVLPEPIISRSHFSVNYDQKSHKFCISDNGTKWGTFMQVNKPTVLQCGDWIRVGVAEFVVRYCGGECACHKWHGQYRAQSSIRRSRQYGLNRSSSASSLPRDRIAAFDLDTSTELGKETQLKAELTLLLNSASPSARWTSTATRLSQELASREAPARICEECSACDD